MVCFFNANRFNYVHKVLRLVLSFSSFTEVIHVKGTLVTFLMYLSFSTIRLVSFICFN